MLMLPLAANSYAVVQLLVDNVFSVSTITHWIRTFTLALTVNNMFAKYATFEKIEIVALMHTAGT